MPRLFVEADPGGDRATLGPDGSRHLRALRLAPGDEIEAIVGPGDVRRATLQVFTRRGAELRLGERVSLGAVDPPRSLVLVAALADLPRFDSVVEKATELGATELVPLRAERSQVGRLTGARRARWERIARAACEQCGRTRSPDLRADGVLEEVLASLPDRSHRVAFDPRADAPWDGDAPRELPLVLFIGPEGGFSPREIETLKRCGALRRSLGPRILRFETAAAAALAIAGSRR